MLDHGGGVRLAARQFAIPPEEWLDLSTGINPMGWVPPAIPRHCWARLPEEEDGLEEGARHYYRTPFLLPMPGSTAAIQLLPRLRPCSRVVVLSPTYSEHAHAWEVTGHALERLSLDELEPIVERFDVVVVVNPNNPTGTLLSPEHLLSWQGRLQHRGGWLVVDEAFMDATPADSLASKVGPPGLIVLRSMGKFFGLAGARVGFLLAENGLLLQMQELLGPWSVAGASRWLAAQALADLPWQAWARRQLPVAADRLRELLDHFGWQPRGGTLLFQWVVTTEDGHVWDALARQGILVRHFPEMGALRFGLPGEESEWARLEAGLAALRRP
ncbi:MAG: threonine-phosphate decarboxylase CobD [Magnetococcus sp. MYC-9]